MKEHQTELVIGIILIIAPWIFGFADVSLAKWFDVFAGLVLVLMNAWQLYGKPVLSIDSAAPANAPSHEEKKKSKKQS